MKKVVRAVVAQRSERSGGRANWGQRGLFVGIGSQSMTEQNRKEKKSGARGVTSLSRPLWVPVASRDHASEVQGGLVEL